MVGSSLAPEQTDKVILASLASPEWVATTDRGTAVGFGDGDHQFCYLPMLTAVAALNAIGDWDGIRRLYRRLMETVSIVTGLIVVVVAGWRTASSSCGSDIRFLR